MYLVCLEENQHRCAFIGFCLRPTKLRLPYTGHTWGNVNTGAHILEMFETKSTQVGLLDDMFKAKSSQVPLLR